MKIFNLAPFNYAFSFNRYAYGNNNPYRYTDPTGMTGEQQTLIYREPATGTHLRDASNVNGHVTFTPPALSGGPSAAAGGGQQDAGGTGTMGAAGGQNTDPLSFKGSLGESPTPDPSLQVSVGFQFAEKISIPELFSISAEINLFSQQTEILQVPTYSAYSSRLGGGIEVFGLAGFGAAIEVSGNSFADYKANLSSGNFSASYFVKLPGISIGSSVGVFGKGASFTVGLPVVNFRGTTSIDTIRKISNDSRK